MGNNTYYPLFDYKVSQEDQGLADYLVESLKERFTGIDQENPMPKDSDELVHLVRNLFPEYVQSDSHARIILELSLQRHSLEYKEMFKFYLN
jgi:hypothetical protein